MTSFRWWRKHGKKVVDAKSADIVLHNIILVYYTRIYITYNVITFVGHREHRFIWGNVNNDAFKCSQKGAGAAQTLSGANVFCTPRVYPTNLRNRHNLTDPWFWMKNSIYRTIQDHYLFSNTFATNCLFIQRTTLIEICLLTSKVGRKHVSSYNFNQCKFLIMFLPCVLM